MRHAILILLALLASCGGEARQHAAPAPAATEVMAALEAALVDPDRGVRYAAILALGKGGVDREILRPLVRDPHWCVRSEAQWWFLRLGVPGRGADALVEEHYEGPSSPAAPPLGSGETQAALRALAGAQRDACVTAANALARAGPDALPALYEALGDPRWRVRTAVLRSLAAHEADAQRVAPFLRSEIVPEAEAACDALKRLGASAAAATAAAMADAHYGALHWGRTIFEHLGEDGSDGVPGLITLLTHQDVNARETAARCLRTVGAPARAAAPALVEALGDEHLCVTANAALALGALGRTPEALAALGEPRARVRAYAAFALGWALGTERKIDQVPFEHRLPVLDLGLTDEAPGPAEVDAALLREYVNEEGEASADPDLGLLLRAIWSGQPGVSIRAAAALPYEVLDARHAGRVMELLLPEGLRVGAPGDFDSIRSIIGSTEIPAYLMYVFKAGLRNNVLESMGSQFHRMALPWHLPVLAWFQRTHDAAATEPPDELWFSQWYSEQHARVLTRQDHGLDPGSDLREIVRVHLEAATTEPTSEVLPFPRWALGKLTFRDEDAPWLLAVAERLEDLHTPRHVTWVPAQAAVLRALGRLGDEASLAYLHRFARPLAKGDIDALTALVRRDDPQALAELERRAQAWDDASGDAYRDLLRLFDVRPAVARRITVERIASIVGPASGEEEDEASIALVDDWDHKATWMGLEVGESAFLGLAHDLEPLLPRMTTAQVAELLTRMPMCNTKVVAAALLERLEGAGHFEAFGLVPGEAASYVRDADRVLAAVHAFDPERVVRLLRRVAAKAGEPSRTYALNVLLRLGDKRSQSAVLAAAGAALPDLFDEQYDGDWRRFPGPGTEAYLLRVIALDRAEGNTPMDLSGDLAALRGFSGQEARDLRKALNFAEADVAEALLDMVVAGRMDALRKRVAELAAGLPQNAAETLYWKTQFGDRQARAELWSIARTARYRQLHHSDEKIYALKRDLTTLPHWITELESNCCRVSDGLDSELFEEGLGMPELYGSEANGIGLSLADRALRWLRVMGGDFVWSPITDAWVRRPE